MSTTQGDLERIESYRAEIERLEGKAAADSFAASFSDDIKVRAQPVDNTGPTVTVALTEGLHAGLRVVCRRLAPPGIWHEFANAAQTIEDVYNRNLHFGDEVLLSWNLY